MNSEDRTNDETSPNWLERIGRLIGGEPKDRRQLVELLLLARERGLMDRETLGMMLGALRMAERRVRDVMTERPKMVVLRRDDDLEEVLRVAIESAHARIPVIGEDVDEVVGILLQKDLLEWLRQGREAEFRLQELMREVLIVPESMRLGGLLKELRSNRNHLAIVVDEYGSTAGLVTLEDVLEEIVGEIEDEHDDPDEGQAPEQG